jgi:prephenate dehydratase
VLTRIADEGINLSKLQSFPIPGSDFLYGFHADMELESAAQLNKVLEKIKPLTADIKVYGVYKRGEWK